MTFHSVRHEVRAGQRTGGFDRRLLPAMLILSSAMSGQLSAQESTTAGSVMEAISSNPVSRFLPTLWDLAVQGGVFMIPIAVASVVTLTFTLERLFGLRRGRILPGRLIRGLRELMSQGTVDPRKLWDLCEYRPSPLASVIRAAVLKTGRPHAELEKSVEDAVARETADMARNLRPINLVASVSPLLGLLGTVQGMIMAFMVTSSTTSTGTAKAQELAHGIYTALVTTFAGLCVAVVSIILANFLEGRIERRLRQLEALFLDLLPQLERYEGRLRLTEAVGDPEAGLQVRPLRPASTTAVSATAPSGRERGDRSGETDGAVENESAVRPSSDSSAAAGDGRTFSGNPTTTGNAAEVGGSRATKLVRGVEVSRGTGRSGEGTAKSESPVGSLRANFNR